MLQHSSTTCDVALHFEALYCHRGIIFAFVALGTTLASWVSLYKPDICFSTVEHKELRDWQETRKSRLHSADEEQRDFSGRSHL